MTQAFVYKWTQLSTLKWYIGSRTARNCHVDDGYICSSKTVKPMILENKNEWIREIIATGEPEIMHNFETVILQALDAKNDPSSFNLHNGDGKFTTLGQDPWFNDLPKEQHPAYGNTPWNKGLTLTDEQKKNHFGHHSWCKGKAVRLNPEGEFKKGHGAWNAGIKGKDSHSYGYVPTDKTKKRLSESQQGENNSMFGKTPWNKGIKTGKKWYTNGTISKLFELGTEPFGFKPGRICRKAGSVTEVT